MRAKRIWFSIAVAMCCMVSPIAAAQSGSALPPSIASAGVTQAEWDAIEEEVRRQARRAGVAEAALLAAAERAGINLARSGRFDAASLRDAIINQLETQARTISELQERLTVLVRAADPEIASLLSAARQAVEEGRLEDAQGFLAVAEESDLAAIVVAEARSESTRTRLAENILLRGSLARLANPSEIGRIRDAATRYEQALAGMDRGLAPNDWARTQFNLGVAHALLAQAGEADSRVLAIAAFAASREGYAALGESIAADRAQQLADAIRPQ